MGKVERVMHAKPYEYATDVSIFLTRIIISPLLSLVLFTVQGLATYSELLEKSQQASFSVGCYVRQENTYGKGGTERRGVVSLE